MQKWLFPLNAVLVLLIITVLALIASQIVSYRLGRLFPAGAPKAPAAVAPAPPTEDLTSYAAILEKGLFGKTTQGKLTPVVQAAPQATPAATAQSDLVLLGTVMGSFRESFALILKQSTKEERVFRMGDKVFDMGPLVGVRKESAEILSGGQRIKIHTPTSVPGESGGAPPPGQVPQQAGGLASQVGSGSYVIDQRSLNAALDNMGQIMTDARLLPSVKDGKVEGFRATEVKPAGVFGMIGIKNGDVLQKINDFPIDSPEKAVQSFVTLKGQSRIKLDLIRDGRPVTFTYDIR